MTEIWSTVQHYKTKDIKLSITLFEVLLRIHQFISPPITSLLNDDFKFHLLAETMKISNELDSLWLN